ncbi:Carboxypeptidase [Mycena kentingensis (nom. inval.)]|nr:Carboxypeptidase [Mycena kentingensis (nom. inval.)]
MAEEFEQPLNPLGRTISDLFYTTTDQHCGIATLPNELLVEIFTYSPSTILLDAPDFQTAHFLTSGPIPLSHVCARWRLILLAIPHFWTQIVLSRPTWAIEMLRRSGTLPLTVGMNLGAASSRATRMRKILFGQLGRIRELRVKRAVYSNFPAALMRSPAPMLERFCLRTTATMTYRVPPGLFARQTPKLRQITLDKFCRLFYDDDEEVREEAGPPFWANIAQLRMLAFRMPHGKSADEVVALFRKRLSALARLELDPLPDEYGELVVAGAAVGIEVLGSLPCRSSWPSSPQPKAVFQAPQYDAGLFTPLEDMNALSATEFTTLGHPEFPKYGVRIKKSAFCDETVKSYTGYIDIEARHIFFYFFESRSDPDKDDIIFWTNGGPGCSSSLGLFMELGPCRILDANGTKYHPESWNTNANIFFVDQPIGVGFSYADYGETVSTTEEGAKDIAAFMFVFFEHFSKFKGRALHMAGESYGGRYVPVFAAEVYDQNAKLVAAGYEPINLKSVMIGNGITDFYHQMSSVFDMQCTNASIEPTSSIEDCVAIKRMIPRCQKRLKESCMDTFDAVDCGEAANFCSTYLRGPYRKSQRNPYDISKPCDDELLQESLCYPVTAHIRNYLSLPSTRALLGVSPSVPVNFTSCADAVDTAFRAHLDNYIAPTQEYVAGLLERGVKVLIYVGTFDWTCNWVGNQRWTMALEWSGAEAFRKEELNEWCVSGGLKGKERAGLVRSANGLTFLTIDGAGHMVPYDKPKESLDLLQRWLSGEGF